jgi:hypothetical protein
MKKVLMVFGGIGFIVPILLILAIRFEMYSNPGDVPKTFLIWRYLWPSSFWLHLTNLPGENFWPGDFFVWVLSIGVNVLVYGTIGLIGRWGWNFFLERN